jgi:hypothetical protein
MPTSQQIAEKVLLINVYTMPNGVTACIKDEKVDIRIENK